MKIKRNFDKLYKTNPDPWDIGNADYGRYNIYYDLVVKHSKVKARFLT